MRAPPMVEEIDDGGVVGIVERVAIDVAKATGMVCTRVPRPTSRAGEPAECGRCHAFAVARSILVIVWRLLNGPNTRYHDLGSGFYVHNPTGAPPRTSLLARPTPDGPSPFSDQFWGVSGVSD